MTLLQVDHLRIVAETRRSTQVLVEDVSFDVAAGEFVGIVGESGCGKSMTALALTGLLPQPVVHTAGGRVLFGGEDVLTMTPRRLRHLRGGQIGMIFQDPMSSLNPVRNVGSQIVEAIRLHEPIPHEAAWTRAVAALHEVNIPAAEERAWAYPHQLSGGMRQRVMIAMAIACRPKLLIADEPTTALDVTIQGQILYEMQKLCRERQTALIWITHDLSVVSSLADKICVMYAGRIVEQGPIHDVLTRPLHPYTNGLIGSVPSRNRRARRLTQIPGMTPSLLNLPAGCIFRTRCTRASARCHEMPELDEARPGQRVRCFHPHLEQPALAEAGASGTEA